MFDRILIANRGEIACRVIGSARKLGVETVAVYSDADADALHVRMADMAVRLGPAPVAESYLRGDLIIQAALATGAQAIHPGYGFLSENPDFVAAVAAAGLVFIGPSAAAIRAMGLKDAAKDLMEQAGVPVVPDYRGDVQDPDHLAAQADRIGYPVLIKAVAGGGGKGMRQVAEPANFRENLVSAQSEALTAFGNARVLIEKYIENPRHIEVQVFGDGTTAVHLFERDCSLQRRHQKVIEEAPAPHMPADLRAAMGTAAVRAATAIGYAGAGTVEFIVDGAGGLRADGFWFMEMNTRLQVEHPVTEAITGVDLVDWQLRIAAGHPLPMQQSDLTITGHAFEARLYAEDVPAGFLPATGTLAHLSFPDTARIDSGVETGSEISPWYDPMIAKVIVHGPDRATALGMLQSALAATQVAGLTTNLGFLQRLAADAGFAAGDVTTGLIAARGDALIAAPTPAPAQIIWAAVVAAGLDQPAQDHQGFSLWSALHQTIAIGDTQVTLTAHGPDRITATLGDVSCILTRDALGWRSDGQRCGTALRHGQNVTLFGRDPVTIPLPDPLDRADTTDGGDVVLAPMPGLVQSVTVSTGDTVTADQPMIVLEAMKMEHVLRAPRAGVVQSVATTPGDQVAAGAVLVTLDDDIPTDPMLKDDA